MTTLVNKGLVAGAGGVTVESGMKTLSGKWSISALTLIELLVVLAVFAGAPRATAQSSQFFRISGPAATTITAFNSDGTLIWSNAQPSTNYTVQTVAALSGGTNWVDYVQLPVTNTVNTNQIISFNLPVGMTFIPAGFFTMGDNLDGEGDAMPTISVSVSAFYMDINLVSYGQWQSIYIWATNHGYGFDNSGSGKATNHPVQTINWYDTVKWCNARSQQTGLTPVYYTDAGMTQVYTNGGLGLYANWAANGYRLSTEAEWEKAARGGLNGKRFPWGDVITENLANYLGNTNFYAYDLGPNGYNTAFTNGVTPFTSPVGSFAANGYGIYDMAGNVFEWCWDWYGTPYAGGSDPHGSTPGPTHVLRGGGWNFGASSSTCAGRTAVPPNFADTFVGFRCVRGF